MVPAFKGTSNLVRRYPKEGAANARWEYVNVRLQMLVYTNILTCKTAELGKASRKKNDLYLGLEGWVRFSQGQERHLGRGSMVTKHVGKSEHKLVIGE